VNKFSASRSVYRRRRWRRGNGMQFNVSLRVPVVVQEKRTKDYEVNTQYSREKHEMIIAK
jgi:hypothetical protein